MKKHKKKCCCDPSLDTSILTDIKKYLGPSVVYTAFDMDIIMNINAAFFTLFQLGVGPTDEAFTIEDNSAVWSSFSDDKGIVSATKQYIYLKVRNVFDPPTSSYVLQAYETQIQELEWRLREMASGSFDEDEEDDNCCHCGGGHKPEKPDDGDSSSSNYTLPPATAETLGGVIVGDNIDVDEEGRISIDKVQLGEIDVATDEDIMEVFNNVFGKE